MTDQPVTDQPHRPPRSWLRRMAAAFTALFCIQTLLAAAPAYAQLSAAADAPAARRPMFDAARNGVLIVLIAPPSRAGVSRNQYEQFNVGGNGLILNNSTGGANTRLGGAIARNPLLGRTPASVILNEVTSAHASRLGGAIEVGGQAANVVIANPNGIYCDACGFLNTARATLSTGVPQFGPDGRLTGLNVRQSLITVGPRGLHATEQQQLDLLARGLVLEGDVFAQGLHAVIGANQVLYDSGSWTALDGGGDAPRFAVDIKQLGGMHAGQIYLVATDKGLGVNSTGRLSTLAGDLVLSAQGDLSLRDSYSAADMTLSSTGRVTLSGQTIAEGAAHIQAPVQIVNSAQAQLQAGRLSLATASLDNSGSLAQLTAHMPLSLQLAGGLRNTGTIYAAGELQLEAPSITAGMSERGTLLAGTGLRLTGDALHLRGQALTADRDISVAAAALHITDSQLQAGGSAVVQSPGALTLENSLVLANQTARIEAGDVALDRSRVAALAGVRITSAGSLRGNAADANSNAALEMRAQRIDWQAGSVSAASAVDLRAGEEVTLLGAQLLSGQQIALTGEGVDTSGSVVAADRVSVDAGRGALKNREGQLLASASSGPSLTLAAGAIDNTGGELRSNGQLAMSTGGGALVNTGGVIAASTAAVGGLASLDNRQGLVHVEHDLTLASAGFDNSHGAIVAGGSLLIEATGPVVRNTEGQLRAAGHLKLRAGSDLHSGGATILAGETLQLEAGWADLREATAIAAGNLSIKAGELQAEAARVFSGRDLRVRAESLTGGRWSAERQLQVDARGALDLRGGSMMASDSVTVLAQGIRTDGAQVAATRVALDAGTGDLSNVGGSIVALAPSGEALALRARSVDNTGGTIVTAGDALLDADGAVINDGGTLQSEGGLQLRTSGLLNRDGIVSTGSSLALQGFAVDNRGGAIQTQGELRIDTAGEALQNQAGMLIAESDLSLATGVLDTHQGTIHASGAADIRASRLDGNQADIRTLNQLQVRASQGMSLTDALLVTEGSLDIFGGDGLDATGATLSAGTALNATAGTIGLDGAKLAAGDHIEVSADGGVNARAARIGAINGIGLRAGQGDLAAADVLVYSQSGDIEIAAARVQTAAQQPTGGQQPLTGLMAGGSVLIEATQDVDLSHSATHAGGDIDIETPASVRNDGGQLAAKGSVRLSGVTVSNRGGSIDAQGPIDLRLGAGGLDNDSGRIASFDLLALTRTDGVAATVSNAGGLIETSGPMHLHLRELNNQGGTIQALAGLTLSGGAIDNTAGKLAARGNVRLDTGGAAFKGAGGSVLSTEGDVTLLAGDTDLDGAELLAGRSLTLRATDARLSRAKLVAGTQATLAARELAASDALMFSQGALTLSAKGAIAADRATIASGEAVVASAGRGISLRQGKVSARTITLDAGAEIDNSAGQLTANGTDGLALSLRGQGLVNEGGTIASLSDLSIDTGAGHVRNQGGSIQASAAAEVRANELRNRGGTIAANEALHVDAARIDNTGGTLRSTRSSVSITADALTNARKQAGEPGGYIAAATDVDLNVAGHIDNDHGDIAAGDGDITLVAGSYGGNGGNFFAGRDLNLAAGGALDLAGTTLQAGRDLGLKAGAALDLTTPVALQFGRDLSVAAHGINTAGRTLAGRHISFDAGQGDIDNTGGSLVAEGDLTLATGAALRNTDGKLVAITGAATVKGQYIENLRGLIAAATHNAVDAGEGQLSNQGGIVTGHTVAIAGAVQNADGVISGGHAVTLRTHALDNTAGVIEAGLGGIDIDTQGHKLTNRRSGSARGIVSAGDVRIAAGEIDNRSGYVGASSSLDIRHSTSLANQGGTLLGLGDSRIVSSGIVDNAGGLILGGADLALSAARLVNRGAGSTVFAGRDLHLQADTVDNSGSRDSANSTGLLAGRDAAIVTGTLDNSDGALIATRQLTVHATSLVDNTGGQVAGDTVQVQTQRLKNTGGRVDAQQQLHLEVAQLGGDGVLASRGSVSLDLDGDFTNQGEVSAGSDLSLRTSGVYTNEAAVSARGRLAIKAAALRNTASGAIDGDQTTVEVVGELLNEGLINAQAQAASLTANHVRNHGRIFGDQVFIDAAEVINEAPAGGDGAAIASRGGAVLIDAALRNTGDSLVFSAGDLRVKGAVTNIGSALNAQRHIVIDGAVQNLNAGIAVQTQARHEAAPAVYITPVDSTTRYERSTLAWLGHDAGKWVLPSTTYPFDVFGAERLVPHAHCPIDPDGGVGICSYRYSPNDPIWALLSVPSPGPAPTPPGPSNSCSVDVDGEFQRTTQGECGAYWDALDTYHQVTIPAAGAQLDTAIASFNGDLESRTVTHWYETTLTGRRISETVLTASQPARILAGGDISIASGSNVDSLILARGTPDVRVDNIATTGRRETTEEGSIVVSRHVWSGGLNTDDSREVGAPQPIASAPVVEVIDLPVLQPLASQPPSAPNSGNVSLPSGAAPVPTIGRTASARGIAPWKNPAEGVSIANPSTPPPTPGPDTAPVVVTGATLPNPVLVHLPIDVQPPPQAPLPGSILATQLRRDQLQAVKSLQVDLATFAAPARWQAPTGPGAFRRPPPPAVKAAGYTTVHANLPVTAPANQIFRIDRGAGGVLVITDAAFVGQQSFVSSQYLLDQLDGNADRTFKRYGDGFAEQRLIDDQVFALTGRRFLSSYESTAEQYLALLDAGAMFARQYQLSPGVALSAEQMALLTTDIVWLELRSVTLPDGSSAEVLVPTVYLRRPLESDFTPAGALIAGSDVMLRSTGDLTNSGTVFAYGDGATGTGKLMVEARNLAHSGTLAGHDIQVNVQQTLDSAGGIVQGVGEGSSARLNARDIVLRTIAQNSEATIDGPNGTSRGTRTSASRIATVQADGVTLSALNDIRLEGASVRAVRDLWVEAGGDISVDAVATGYVLDVPLNGSGNGRSSFYRVDSTTHLGSELVAGGNAVLLADGAINMTGSAVQAGRALEIEADSVNVQAAIDSESIDQQAAGRNGYERVARSDQALSGGVLSAGEDVTVVADNDITGLGVAITSEAGAVKLIAGGDVHLGTVTTEHTNEHERFNRSNDFLSSGTSLLESQSESSLAQGSLVASDSVYIQAGRIGPDGRLVSGNVTVDGSSVAGKNDVAIAAGQRVIIRSATDTETHSSFQEDKLQGFGAMGGLSYGQRQESARENGTRTAAVASTVGSMQGDVRIQSEGSVDVVGSRLIAGEGDIDVTGKRVSITEAREGAAGQSEQRQSQSGLSVSASSPILTAARTADQVMRAAGDTDDPRMRAMAAATVALAGAKAAAEMARNPGIRISISVGTNRSESQSEHRSEGAAGSTVQAGGDVTIRATGAGQDSDLLVRGSQISAGGRVGLQADDRIELVAARNASQERSSHSSSSASVGVSYEVGAGGAGVGFSASASRGNGNSQGEGESWTNTQVQAGQQVVLQSGGDTDLRGAVIAAPRVTGRVGGNLLLESLQDTSSYQSRSSSIGGSVTVGGGFAGSVQASRSRIESDYASVNEQTAIRAGDGGFDIDVEGTTTLRGGAITSSEAAVQAGRNVFDTDELVLEDIENRADYQGSSAGITLASSPDDKGERTPAGSGAGAGSVSGNAHTVTRAAISGIAGDTAARTGDAQGGIAQIFDAERVQAEVDAQVEITQAFGQAAAEAVGRHAAERMDEAAAQSREAESLREHAQAMRDLDPESAQALEQQAQQLDISAQTIRDEWGDNGTSRLAAHAVVGGLTGGIGGVAGGLTAAVTAPELFTSLVEAGVPPEVAQSLTAVGSGLIGASVGGAEGGAAAVNEAGNNTIPTLMRLVEMGRAAATGAGRSAMAWCANNSQCRTVVSAALIGGAVNQQRVATQPSSVDQIPGYDGTPIPPLGGPTVTPDPGERTASTTSYPSEPTSRGQHLDGYQAVEQAPEDHATSSPVQSGGASSPLMLSESGPPQEPQLPNLISSARARHILWGENPNSGGHLWPGQPGKTPFPQSWSAEQVLTEIAAVANDPNSTRRVQANGREVVVGVRRGVEIEVVLEPASRGGGVVTGYPLNLPRNPK